MVCLRVLIIPLISGLQPAAFHLSVLLLHHLLHGLLLPPGGYIRKHFILQEIQSNYNKYCTTSDNSYFHNTKWPFFPENVCAGALYKPTLPNLML